MADAANEIKAKVEVTEENAQALRDLAQALAEDRDEVEGFNWSPEDPDNVRIPIKIMMMEIGSISIDIGITLGPGGGDGGGIPKLPKLPGT